MRLAARHGAKVGERRPSPRRSLARVPPITLVRIFLAWRASGALRRKSRMVEMRRRGDGAQPAHVEPLRLTSSRSASDVAARGGGDIIDNAEATRSGPPIGRRRRRGSEQAWPSRIGSKYSGVGGGGEASIVLSRRGGGKIGGGTLAVSAGRQRRGRNFTTAPTSISGADALSGITPSRARAR